MVFRARTSRPFKATVKRKSTWVASADITGTSTLAASSIVLNQSFLITQAANPSIVQGTIVRTRGIWAVRSDQAAASEDYIVGMGMGVVSEAAASLGITALPTPFTDETWDGWFVYDSILNGISFSDATGIREPAFVNHHFDSKAQRKVGDDSAVVVVLENSSTVGLQFMIKFRMLFKLP